MDRQKIINTITEELKRQNKTQKWLADQAEEKKQNISGYLSGMTKFSLKKANRLLKPLGLYARIATHIEKVDKNEEELEK